MELTGRVIWSADVSFEELMSVINEKPLPQGTIIKLDRAFFETEDKEMIDICQDAGYPVFADAKIIEIPDKCIKIAQAYLKHKPYMLNIMAGACSSGDFELFDENGEPKDIKKVDCLKRFADLCRENGTKPCGVTVLTSKTESLCLNEFDCMPLDQVMTYMGMLYDAGMTDVVCSPLEAGHIREQEKYDGISVNTPGIRLPGDDVRDQARVTTPAIAFKNGVDKVVIGSSLTDGDGNICERLRRNYARLEEHIAQAFSD